MLISQSDNTKIFNTERFFVEIKNGKFYFGEQGKGKFTLGSKLYPVGKRAEIFTYGVTENAPKYKEIVEQLERSNWKFEAGYCYRNADMLQQIFKANGIDAKYYSGWVFAGPTLPVHHAWVVVDGFVYDLGIHHSSQKVLYDQIAQGKNPYSEKNVREVARASKNIHPVDDNFVWGSVPQEMMYVGAENTPNGARVQYGKATKEGKHPSYPRMTKETRYGRSQYQQMLKDSE